MSCEHFLVVSSCVFVIKYKLKEGCVYVGGSSLDGRAEASAAVLT